ncbi:MAG: tetratricopeptide repeat protein [Chloroflexota bacterium]
MSSRQALEEAIVALEGQRHILGDRVVETSVAALRKQLIELEATEPADTLRKQVTILFADIVGSTAISERLDPEDVLEVMDGGLKVFGEAIRAQGGFIGRFMGDGMLAFFGVPLAREDDPQRAVQAGLAILAASAAYSEQLAERWEIDDYAVRVGINTGLVVMGEVGTSDVVDYTAMGDAVNLAARLETSAPLNGMLIGHDTYRHVRGIFDVEPLPPMQLKGKKDLTQVYRVLQLKPRAFRKGTRGIEGIETRMVGRQQELAQLQRLFQSTLEAKEGQLVMVVGEAGLGKSRLLYEFDNWAELRPEHFYFFQGRATLEMQNVPYSLLRDLFAFRFEIQDSDSTTAVWQKFERNIPQGEMEAHFIGQLLGFDFSESPHLAAVATDPKQLYSRAFQYLVTFFRQLAAEFPLFWMLDDLHWADGRSLDLLEALLPRLADQPFFIMCATRPAFFERRPNWNGRREETAVVSSTLTLSPLSEQDSHLLVGELLQKVADLPEQLRRLAVNNAEGNPFYIEELIKILIEDGVIVKGVTQWRVEPSRLITMRVPPTLTAVLQARLDSLKPIDRIIIQQASVVGRHFWDRVVARVHQNSGQTPENKQLVTTLTTLQQKEMIFQRQRSAFAGTREYIFKHAIMREVTYESVLKRIRPRYHRLVADWLIEYSGERRAEVVGLIADHLELSDDAARAIPYLQQAGEQARAQYANEEAIDYFSRALALVSDKDVLSKVTLLLLREQVCEELGQRARQLVDLELCERLVVQIEGEKRPFLQITIAVRRANYHESVGEFTAAIASAKTAVALAHAANLPRQEALGHLYWGRPLWKMGQYDAARIRLTKAYHLASSVDAKAEEAIILLNLGNTNALQSNLASAEQSYLQALDLYRTLKNLRGEGAIVGNLGNISKLLGQTEKAADYYEQAMMLAQKIGNVELEATWLGNLSALYRQKGQLSYALAYQQQALNISRKINDLRNLTIWFTTLGEIYLTLGQFSQALKLEQEGLALAQKIGSRITEAEAHHYLGMITFALGDLVTAQNHLEQAVTVAQDSNDSVSGAWHLYDLGRVLQAQGEGEQAALMLAQSAEQYQLHDYPEEHLAAQVGLAYVWLGQGKSAAALALVEPALAFLQEGELNTLYFPFDVYLSCYDICQANQDSRASLVAQKGQTLLHKWADSIEDVALRQSFLENVATHRTLAAL